MKAKVSKKGIEIKKVLGINLIAKGHIYDDSRNLIEDVAYYDYSIKGGKESVVKSK